MGTVYRKVEWHCRTCAQRISKKNLQSCRSAGHEVDERQSSIWTIKYYRNKKAYHESSESNRKGDAQRLLKEREGDIAHGKPITPQMGKLTFENATKDLLADYRSKNQRSYDVVERRIRLHLTPFFERYRMADITTSHVRAYIVKRQSDLSVLVRKARAFTLPDKSSKVLPEERRPASDAEINRELALLKRMFSLACQAGLLLHRPHIPMLREQNTRTGFFEPEQLSSVLAHLPPEIRPVIRFAHITGWRIASEVLPLEWRRVDFLVGTVTLDPHTTKNGEGRTFPMTKTLRQLLEGQKAEHDRLKKAGHILPQVFFREVAEGRGGEKKPRPIKSFGTAWKTACRRAGCPGRIPHDLRRTAIRNLVRAGIPERVAMMMTGHKTRSVFERYNIVSEGDMREAAQKLDRIAALGS